MRSALILLAFGFLLSTAGAQQYEGTIQTQTSPTPVRVALERMSPTERANSSISVEFESSDGQAVSLGRLVERLWNGGQYDEALAQLGNLEARVGRVAIGNSWRRPVPTLAADSWGTDVRIGDRDSLLAITLDVDPSSGNLFAALRHSGGGPHWSLCMSTDNGSSWDETFTWVGSPSTWLDAEVLRHYTYVAYNSPRENPQQVRLRRFNCGDGSADTFRTGANWVAACTLDVGDTMKEVSLVNFADAEMYMTTLVSDGNVSLSQANANGVPWRPRSHPIASGASNGLAATENPSSDTIYYFFSYLDTSDTLRVYRWSWSHFTQRLALFAGRGASSSISAYNDTVICVYDDEVSTPPRVRYAIYYRDDDTWTIGTLSDSSVAADAPAVLTSSGDAFAAVYRHCASPRELRFCQRTDGEPWSDPVSIADNEPYGNRPGFVYLGSGAYGVAYLSDTSPVVGGAYFDKSGSPSSLAEQRRLSADRNDLSVTPSPLREHGRLSYALDHAAYLRVQVYDRAGRIVRTLFDGPSPGGRQSLRLDATGMSPGVYFCRLTAGSASSIEASRVMRDASSVIKFVVTR